MDTVLRRYFTGNALLGDFLIDGARGIEGEEVKRLLRLQALLFDRLIAVIGEEYRRGQQGPTSMKERRRLDLVKGLLAGKPLDASELAYDLEGTHIAILGRGPGLEGILKGLASSLGRRLLMVCPEEQIIWAWLGATERQGAGGLERDSTPPPGVTLSLGEPADGIEGWRRTHRQAKAAWPVALRGQERLVRYGEVSLLASVLGDGLLLGFLRETYLRPLREEPGGGELTRESLRAYFAAGCNLSSAAAASGLNRNTISRRIRGFEEAIGRPLSECAPECEVALAFEGLVSA